MQQSDSIIHTYIFFRLFSLIGITKYCSLSLFKLVKPIFFNLPFAHFLSSNCANIPLLLSLLTKIVCWMRFQILWHILIIKEMLAHHCLRPSTLLDSVGCKIIHWVHTLPLRIQSLLGYKAKDKQFSPQVALTPVKRAEKNEVISVGTLRLHRLGQILICKEEDSN